MEIIFIIDEIFNAEDPKVFKSYLTSDAGVKFSKQIAASKTFENFHRMYLYVLTDLVVANIITRLQSANLILGDEVISELSNLISLKYIVIRGDATLFGTIMTETMQLVHSSKCDEEIRNQYKEELLKRENAKKVNSVELAQLRTDVRNLLETLRGEIFHGSSLYELIYQIILSRNLSEFLTNFDQEKYSDTVKMALNIINSYES
jgi:hypothetical protein